MSKIVMLADLHGNMPATLAMEEELNRIEPDEVWFLGDCVGKGPENDKTCDWVQKHCNYFLGGNWDYGISSTDESETCDFYRNQLGMKRLEWLQQLPAELEITISGISFRLVHGRPVLPLFQSCDRDELMCSFLKTENKTFGGLVCADSHRPYIRAMNAGYIINTGSVGNSICMPKAHALLIEGEKDCMEPAPIRFTTLCIPYENEAAAQIARDSELPNKEAYIKEVITGIYSRH